MPLAASPLICIRINCLPRFRDNLTARQNHHRRKTRIERQSRWFECADENIQKRRRQGAKPYPPLDLYQSTPCGTSWRDIPETISTRRLDLSGRIDLVSRTPFPSSPTWVRLPGHGYGHRPPVLFIVASVNDADPATALSLDPDATAPHGPTATGIDPFPKSAECCHPILRGSGSTSAPVSSALPEPFPARNDPGLAVSFQSPPLPPVRDLAALTGITVA